MCVCHGDSLEQPISYPSSHPESIKCSAFHQYLSHLSGADSVVDPPQFSHLGHHLINKPTVSPLIIPLLYCHINGLQRASSVEKPWPGGKKKRDGWAAPPVAW